MRQLDNGERVVVLSVEVWFAAQDAIDDQLDVDLPTDAEPGWYATYRGRVVEPTTEEAELHTAVAMVEADHDELVAVLVDGRVWYEHRDWHDDNRPTRAELVDPELIARVRALVRGVDCCEWDGT